jgi:tetratricopeptide (TPR) repeat protein
MRLTLVFLCVTPNLSVFAQSGDIIEMARQRDREPAAAPAEFGGSQHTAILWPEYSADFDKDGKGLSIKAADRASAISARRLAHKPPNAARKAFERGIQARLKGGIAEAIQDLTEAVRLDPAYPEALAELGALHLRNGEAQRGLDALERALSIDKNSVELLGNQAWALLVLKRPAEAERAARRAVQLAPKSVSAHYLVGMALVQQGLYTREATEHLGIVADTYPDAREWVLWLQRYLAPP